MKFKVENPALNFVLMFCVWLDRFIVQIKKNHPNDRNQFYPGFETGFSGKYIFTQGSSTQKKNGSGHPRYVAPVKSSLLSGGTSNVMKS